MIKLKNLVMQMKDAEFEAFSYQLKESKADKFYNLFYFLKEDKLSEEEIAENLKVNSNAYYTLKSRLYTKIQEFLTSDITGNKMDLLRTVANIPVLLYNTPRETALAVLNKLEKELIEFDMPYELTDVYNSLKKLHLHSPKYYEYTQLYNRHVAYTIALDKAEDLLARFVSLTAEYYMSRSKESLELLWLIKKEMKNLCALYASHHLTIYKNILDISFALFVPLPEAIEEDEAVEDLLIATEKILKNYPKDANYSFLYNVYNFLSFEYYHSLKQYKKEVQYFEVVNTHLPSFMYYNFCTFNSKFLISKLERYVQLGLEKTLYEENKTLFAEYLPDPNDVPNFINFLKYMAMGAFYEENYNESVSILNRLLNEVSFKNFAHAEVEVKLLLALSYSMVNKYDPAFSLLRSVSRKLRELSDTQDLDNAVTFAKMLSMQMETSSKSSEDKLLKLRDKFELLNQGNSRMLSFLKLDDAFIKILAKTIK